MTFKGTPKEFAALVLALQERLDTETVLASITKEALHSSSTKVATAICP